MVQYASIQTETFSLTQGVRQGAILSPLLYNIYTEDLLQEIKSLKIGAFLPNNYHTAIVVYADDIILLSPNLKHLQTMISHCEQHGHKLGLKFNQTKTQFVTSGTSRIKKPTITLNNTSILPQDRLTHLGFKWTLKGSKLNLDHHKDTRISELWAITTSLIAAGIRHCHPNSIVTIFNSILMPKLLYGLELVKLTKTDQESLNRQARMCVKSLFNVSKKSRNYIHELYQILDTTTLIDKRKIRLFRQLLANTSTKEYVFRLLHSTDIDFSFVSDVYHVTQQRNLDIVKLMICKNYKLNVANVAITEALEKCKHYIQNWHLYENRIAFRDLLQANVYKTSTEK